MINESMYDEKTIKEQLRLVPKVESALEALSEILKLATDNRGHILLVDDNAWKALKLLAITKIARRGLKIVKGCKV